MSEERELFSGRTEAEDPEIEKAEVEAHQKAARLANEDDSSDAGEDVEAHMRAAKP